MTKTLILPGLRGSPTRQTQPGRTTSRVGAVNPGNIASGSGPSPCGQRQRTAFAAECAAGQTGPTHADLTQDRRA